MDIGDQDEIGGWEIVVASLRRVDVDGFSGSLKEHAGMHDRRDANGPRGGLENVGGPGRLREERDGYGECEDSKRAGAHMAVYCSERARVAGVRYKTRDIKEKARFLQRPP